jgi:hypothetical protein
MRRRIVRLQRSHCARKSGADAAHVYGKYALWKEELRTVVRPLSNSAIYRIVAQQLKRRHRQKDELNSAHSFRICTGILCAAAMVERIVLFSAQR